MRILLIEDAWMIRAMIAEELTAQGFEVREAESGDHALTLIAQASTTFSLLVTDIRMPGRPSGIDVARLLRARCPDIPVIYMAAQPDALNDAVRDGPYGSAWFAHRDAAGQIAGIEMRGPDYRGFSADGTKTLFALPGRPPSNTTPITRLVVCEAPIDAMSLAGIERLRVDTLYAATAGGMGPGTIAALQALLQDLAVQPEAVLVAATDADTAGERYAARLAELAAEAGVRSSRILPFDGHKDWNEVAIARRQAALAQPRSAQRCPTL